MLNKALAMHSTDLGLPAGKTKVDLATHHCLGFESFNRLAL
ncbi:MAG: hypothetical protein OFPI_02720 [Osedax symbiont Rs2]|nr:MAG: hypothetical protein OFPI_02720 [Osedax symbiont Rs2]